MPLQYRSFSFGGTPGRLPPLDMSRALLGFGLVPVLPAFYGAIFFAQPWALPYGLLLAYPSALLLGPPLLLALRRCCWQRWWHLGLAGAVCALPTIALYRWHGAPPQFEAFSALNALYLAAGGGLTGLAFWLVVLSGATPVSWRLLFGVHFED